MSQAQVSMDQFLRLSKRLDEFAQRVNDEVVLKVFPVGSLFLSLVEVNPSNCFGGQWERYAKGCCLVGVDPNDADFSQVNRPVGSKTVALTEMQNGAHTHLQNAHTHTQNVHTHVQNIHGHSIPVLSGTAAGAGAHNHGIGYNGDAAFGSGKPRIAGSDYTAIAMDVIQPSGTHSHSVTTVASTSGNTAAVNQNTAAINQNAVAVNQSSGSGAPHNNVQPSVPVYIWVRVA